MPTTHKIQCRCGQVRGLLKATRPSNRCVCYCADCQAFARHLQARDAMDSQGGTDIIQVPASNLVFTQGAEQLACIRLTDKGLLRWYASCCGTLIGNTPADWKVSFVGLIHTCLRGGSPSVDESFGPVTMRVGVNSAIGANKPAAVGLFSGIAKAVLIIVRGRFGGAYRASPFFNPQTGLPVAKPKVLSAEELAAARRPA
jgi:hypothetical protein